MTTIAEALGIDWTARLSDESPEYRLTHHAQKQAQAKGWTSQQVLDAANRPHHTYPSGRVPGQYRHVKGDIVAIVDPVQHRVVTVYQDVEETDLRPDQTDRDAQTYAKRHASLGCK
ncbi:hypothetical protein EV284_3441 [Streptomyces sp. BK022]|uniref:hypothetical protein n=1 Tax=Streptomyces sp. BK022 TaxID=2512123 RepID=UPI0010292573|nr:hypothetical protein [Streptomyces sp. BK022]RZU35958.1 hypothetical protein EV284_3441 [Streptomyces sp. BK022]